ncbi:MAG: 30S ribosomal protein S4 [Clostridia bacterium]|nr:30S ribosomal protein S4 [Clostridia bacterium]
MARNRQPILKKSRSLGISLGDMGYTKKPSTRNPGPQRRTKKSEYARQLSEKQKVKFVYGILEKQFHKYYEKASNQKGNTGENMLILIERRLDNVAYHLNFGKTRRMARQMVTHGHLLVNGQKVDIPSYQVKVGDEISVCSKSREVPFYKTLREEGAERSVPKWLELDSENLMGRVVAMPTREDVDMLVEEHLIVELYSR